MTYKEILKIKDECYDCIKKQLGEQHLSVFKYHKGDILPLIHAEVRKDMTCGDIDGFQWDFQKKTLRFIESKRTNENTKESQTRFLKFFANNVQIPVYKFNVYKIISDPPFDKATVVDMKSNLLHEFNNHESFVDWLNVLE